MPNVSYIGREAAKDAFGRALRSVMGRGTDACAVDVSSATSIPVRTLTAHKDEEQLPPLDRALTLMGYFGPSFVNKILSVIDQGGAHHLSDSNDPAVSTPLTLNAAVCAVSALISRQAADGVIDHKDILDQYDSVALLHAECGRYLSRYTLVSGAIHQSIRVSYS